MRDKKRGVINTRTWRAAHPEYARESSRLTWLRWITKRVGVGVDYYDEMLSAQEGCCAICDKEFTTGWANTPRLDHDHQTMTPRGLLCHRCNMAIGNFDENPETLINAAAYLVN